MSTETTVKPIITKHFSEFKLDAYASTPTIELVVFAVQVLQADGVPVAVEEVVSTCFRFFPHSFALKNYFYWPDSALVNRRLHDAKEKGLLKGNASEGYETKGQGRQVAKHVAKALGVLLLVPPKVEVTFSPVVEKKEEEKNEIAPSIPVIKAVKKRETQKKETQPKAAKAVKKAVEKKQTQKPTAKKQTAKVKKEFPAPDKKKSALKKTIKQKVSKPAPKPEFNKKKEKSGKKKLQSVVKPEVKKAESKIEKNAEKKRVSINNKEVRSAVKPEIKNAVPKIEKKVEKAKKESKAQPMQLTMALTSPTAWKKAEAPASKPKVKKEAAQLSVKGEVLTPIAASKEEKDKAAKVIKQIERSDAYQLYRRNGRRAQIGEFDFRNMLFATMESSAETLKRNVELFKRYAGIHFRTDLIAFLEFCEESFASLLISKVKVKGKR